MQSETGFPSSHQLKSYVTSKSCLKLAARCPVSGCWPSCYLNDCNVDCKEFELRKDPNDVSTPVLCHCLPKHSLRSRQEISPGPGVHYLPPGLL